MIEWKKIPKHETYEASTNGDLKTFNWKNKGIEKIMKPARDKCGYLRTMLKNDLTGKFNTIKVHRIIAQTFVDNPKNKPQVNHINGVKDDNRVENLEWCTASENIYHSHRTGLSSNVGEKNPCATLTDKQVLEIRANYVYGKKTRKGETKQQIAERYNTTFSVIKRLIQGKTWKHL
jgi:hypothetical protein